MKCLSTKFNASSKLASAHVMFESRFNARFGVKQRKEKKKKYFFQKMLQISVIFESYILCDRYKNVQTYAGI